MLKKTIKTLFSASLATLLISASAQALEVENAWIREAPPSAQMMGGFMTLKNDSDKPVTLVGLSSKAFPMIMMHKTVEEHGMSRMIKQDQVVIPAHGTLSFRPGSYHLMMTSPGKRLVAGDKVTLTLKFKSGKTMDVVYTVRKGGMLMPSMDGMNTGHDHDD